MLEQVKQYLIDKYNLEINKFNDLKDQIDKLEKDILEDNPNEKYRSAISMLNKKYSFFKKGSKEYKKEKSKLDADYHNSLLLFKQTYDDYTNMRKEASKIDIYGLQRKLNRVQNCTDLKDLNLTEETASKVLMGELEI